MGKRGRKDVFYAPDWLLNYYLKLEFRQKVGQNPCRELPKGRNLMCEKKEIYPRAH